MTDCLENSIGLTLNECDCWEEGKPDDFSELNASSTGHYITEGKDGFSLIPSIYYALDCGQGDNIWDVLLSARSNAAIALRRDLSASLVSSHAIVKSGDASIGLTERRSATTTYADGRNGIVLQARKPIKGGYINIRGINLGFESTDPVTISVTSSIPDFSVDDVEVTPVSGNYAYGATDWKLPLWSEGRTDAPIYSISYDATGARPLTNRLWCCSGNGKFGPVNASGFKGEIPSFSTSVPIKQNAYGLALDSFISCDKTDWLCRYTQIGDYEMSSVIAHTMQFYAVSELTQFVLDSNQINKYTTLSREALYGKRNHAIKRYQDNIQWISQNVPKGASDCVKCSNSKIRLSKATM